MNKKALNRTVVFKLKEKRIGSDSWIKLIKENHAQYPTTLLDTRNDVVFKAIFGKEKNHDILLSLLNAILQEDLEAIVYLDTYLGANYADEKYSVLDIRVRTVKKVEIDIEMQLDYHDGFEGRILMYWARMFAGQLKTGQNYKKLKKTIQISIVNFKFLETEQFHSVFHLLEKNQQFQYTDLIEIHVLELPKVDQSVMLENSDSLKNWMLFLSGDDRTKEALAMNNAEISKAYEELEHVSRDEVMRELAFKREKFLFEQSMRIGAAKDEGRKEGREQGREEGLEQGSQQAKEQAARNSLAMNLDVETVAKITGLPLGEVEVLKENMRLI